jgi:hypothetical protein
MIPNFELYHMKPNHVMPRKFDPPFTKEVLVHYVARGSLLAKDEWLPSLKRFKEAGICLIDCLIFDSSQGEN